jgi:uncharacterized protein (DUF58 family)
MKPSGTPITFTVRGVALFGAAPLLLGAGFLFGYPELAVIGAAGLAALPLAIGYLLWRPRLSVRRVVRPDRVMRGDPSTATLTVHNDGRRAPATVVAHDRVGAGEVPVPVLRLAPGADTVREYPVPTDRRGVVSIGPLLLHRRDPLGLAHASWTRGGVDRVWVHPRAYPLTAVPVGITRSLDGRIDNLPHGTITFDTLREYVVGDELRRVHWRTSARIGELMVRENLDTSLPRLVVLLDNRVSAHPGGAAGGTAESFEAACEAAASVILAGAREELAVALRLVSGVAVGGDGRRLGLTTTAPELLDALAEAQLVAAPDALAHVSARLRQRPAGDTLIFLTGPAPEVSYQATLGTVAGLRGQYPSIVIGVLGTTDPPAAQHGLLVLTAATGEEFAPVWDGVRTW